MIDFKIFRHVPDEKLLEIYKDILHSKEEGLRPCSLDEYAKQVKTFCHFEMLSQATSLVVELFYEEVAFRYFNVSSGLNNVLVEKSYEMTKECNYRMYDNGAENL